MRTIKMPVDDDVKIAVKKSDPFRDEHLQRGGGTTLEPNLTCYCRGTMIRTATGDTPIEDLRIGDFVLTAAGEVRPIGWLGFRGLDCTRHPNPALVWPIRIQAATFGRDQPVRDLWGSPFHSILVKGVLIQVQTLGDA